MNNLEYYTCSGCSKLFQDAAATKEFADKTSTVSPALGHKYTDVWNMDATNHWHACSACGAKENNEAHVPGAAATETTDQTCTVCGYVIQKSTAHTHTYGDHWFNDNSGHWKACACGEMNEKSAHTDADSDQICDACQWTLGEDAVVSTNPGGEGDNTIGDNTPADGEKAGGSWVIIVCILGALVLAGGGVAAFILIKRKKA